jgi:hypothetical protein
MRSVGLGFAFAASVQLVLTSTPAFAQSATAPNAQAATATGTSKAGTAKKKKAGKKKAVTTETSVTTTTAGTVDAPDPAAATTTTTTTTTTTAPAAPATVVVAPAAAPSGSVTVHLNAPSKVALEHRAAGHEAWEFVCNSPCDQAVSPTDEYRVTGAGLNESRPFVLDTSNGDKITLDITPGTHSKFTAGEWILVGGGVFIVGGVVALLAGSSSNTAPGNDGTVTTTKNTNWIFVGSGLILTGVIGGLVGGALMYDNAHTHVDGGRPIDEKKSNDKSNDGISLKVTASRRAPTWHEETGPVITAATNIVPLFQRSF